MEINGPKSPLVLGLKCQMDAVRVIRPILSLYLSGDSGTVGGGGARWHPGWDMSAKGGQHPPCHQCHSVCPPGTLLPTPLAPSSNKVMGLQRDQTFYYHPMSHQSSPFIVNSLHRLDTVCQPQAAHLSLPHSSVTGFSIQLILGWSRDDTMGQQKY